MDPRRKELGEFLRAIRQREAPEAFGFPAGARRRTRGLRREEVAQLAGISPTWYTWLEQGREVSVSADTLDRLAEALKLSRSERNYLFDIAGRRDPRGSTQDADSVPDTLLAALMQIDLPAYVLGRTWDVLAWNRAAADLFHGWLNLAAPEGAPKPNLLRFVFQHPEARRFVVDWEARARRLVAEFRADCRSRLQEPALQRLVAELSQASPEFDRYWRQHDVLERQGGERAFHHPTHGRIRYRQMTLQPVDQEHLKLVLLMPAE
ncbi:MAG: helix-turn-helix transcriptional regulator [Methylophilaceae bacterium]|nr:helix-turn-helix transcriptional regulator [Methylophilaceae bacterium]